MKLSNIFKDERGNIVIAQWPNRQLLIAMLLYGLHYLPYSLAHSVSSWGVPTSLLYWAWLEITQGVNLWRKILGVAVFVNSALSLGRLIFLSLRSYNCVPATLFLSPFAFFFCIHLFHR